jgi:hypothetical protein
MRTTHNPTSIALTAALLMHGGQGGNDAIKRAVELHDEAHEYLEASGQLEPQLEDVTDETADDESTPTRRGRRSKGAD